MKESDDIKVALRSLRISLDVAYLALWVEDIAVIAHPNNDNDVDVDRFFYLVDFASLDERFRPPHFLVPANETALDIVSERTAAVLLSDKHVVSKNQIPQRLGTSHQRIELLDRSGPIQFVISMHGGEDLGEKCSTASYVEKLQTLKLTLAGQLLLDEMHRWKVLRGASDVILRNTSEATNLARMPVMPGGRARAPRLSVPEQLALKLSESMNATALSIFHEPKRDASSITVQATTGLTLSGTEFAHEGAASYTKGCGLTGRVWETGKSIRIPDYSRIAPFHKPICPEELPIATPKTTCLLIPIKDQMNLTRGVLRVVNKSPNKLFPYFTVADQDVMEQVGVLLGSYFGNLELLRDARESEYRRVTYLLNLQHDLLQPVEGMDAHIEWFQTFIFTRGVRQSSQPSLADVSPEYIDKAFRKLDDYAHTNYYLASHIRALVGVGDPIRTSRIQLSELIHLCLTPFIALAKANGIKIKIEWLGLPPIRSDRRRLAIIFYNLISNAIKYFADDERERLIQISSDDRDVAGRVGLVFSDNGIGIPADSEESVFDEFYRSERAEQARPGAGYGIGLYRCREILTTLGGSIELLSRGRPDFERTQFLVRLPIAN